MGITLMREDAAAEKRALPGPIGFIGAGKVGTALAALLNERGVKVAGVTGRTDISTRRMAFAAGLDSSAALPREETLARAAIVFLTVPDDAIGPLCEEIASEEGWREGQAVVHCSGALPSSILQAARAAGAAAASFHPLQAFAGVGAAIANMPGSTFGIEGDPELVDALGAFVDLLGGTALHLTPGQKVLYHAAATIASNYTVTLAAAASDLLVQAGVAPDDNAALRYLLPLLRGTVENMGALGLPAALTGPIARGDEGTVARHIDALQAQDPQLAALYTHLARLTLPLAARKGSLDPAELRALRNRLELEP